MGGEIRFRRLSLDQGLSQSTVHAIAQDDLGFMWFGTWDGLNRFDGVAFRVYQHDLNDSTSLGDDLVTAIAPAPGGDLWVGTGAGLDHYVAALDRFEHYRYAPDDPGSLSQNAVLSVAVAPDGSVWVGTLGGGLNRLDPTTGRAERFRHEPGVKGTLAGDVVRALAVDADGTVWVATDRGLDRFDAELNRFEPVPGIEAGSFRALAVDARRGGLWAGDDAGGVYRIEGGARPRGRRVWTVPGGTTASVDDLMVDWTATVWVATEGRGLWRRDPVRRRFERLESDPEDPESLSTNTITSVFQDRAGALWVGTEGSGVHHFDRHRYKFVPYKVRPATADHNYVRAFVEDASGDLWIGQQGGGLARLDRRTGEYTHYRFDAADPLSLPDDRVFSLHVDRRGDLWVGTADGWFARRRAGRDGFERFRARLAPGPRSFSDAVRRIVEDEAGDLWLAVEGAGLQRFDPRTGSIEAYVHDPSDPTSLASDRLFYVDLAAGGALWVASFGGGLARLDPVSGMVVNYRHDPRDPTSLASDEVISVEVARDGTVWAGTLGGLSGLDPASGRFRNYRRGSGLPNDAVYGVLEDEQGQLWLTLNGGLARFDPRGQSFVTYHAADGLQSNEFNGGAHYRSPSGELFFGGVNGFNAFRLERIPTNLFVPPVRITGLRIQNRAVPIGPDEDGRMILDRAVGFADRVVLSHRDAGITITFAALDFADPGRNRYAYRLEGAEREWTDLGEQRQVTFAALPPGDYVFRVRGSNNDGVWNEEGASLRIVVRPPFWATWWFRGLALALLAGVIALAVRVRMAAVARRAADLERLVGDRTAQVEAQKRQLEAMLDELKETRDELIVVAHRAGMADTATGVLHNVGNILNSLSISASRIQSTLRTSKAAGLARANGLLRENLDRLGAFFASDPRGPKLAEYYLRLEDELEREREGLLDDASRVVTKVAAIGDVIAEQQRMARSEIVVERRSLAEVIEDALELQAASAARHRIEIEKVFGDVPPVPVARTKLIHVLLNLFKNAKESMNARQPDRMVLRIELDRDDTHAEIRVRDNGLGIEPDVMRRIFTHGFTTKEHGHGFGLHSCANYMKEMGGEIRVESEGAGRGATFILRLPLEDADAPAQAEARVSDARELRRRRPEPAAAGGAS